MNYEVRKMDLFDEDIVNNYYLAHCISADFALGAGIAVEFSKKFDMKNKLLKQFPNYIFNGYDCILIDKTFNLVTKKHYHDKPTYASLINSLVKMKTIIEDNKITKIAMPKIGCGLDRLNWNKVEELIQLIFKDLDIEIIICVKE